jgi:hypothetical protein
MTQDLPTPALADDDAGNRSGDRRVCRKIQPPPYQTVDGLVTGDRRSHLDRRASWLREFSLDLDSTGK